MISKQILLQILTILTCYCKTSYMKERKYFWVDYLEILGGFALI